MSDVADAKPLAPPDKGADKPKTAPPPAFEPDHVPARGALRAVAGMLLGVVISALLVWGLFRYFAGVDQSNFPQSIGTQRLEPPLQRLEPPLQRLETTLLGDGPLVRARAAIETERYRWLDATHTRAQVPVSRAMEIVAARGWPDKEAPR